MENVKLLLITGLAFFASKHLRKRLKRSVKRLLPSHLERWESLAEEASESSGVPAEVILSIISIESSGNPSAYRAEPQLETASFGLMQVLGLTARSQLGFRGDDDDLFDPALNVELGTRYLAWQYSRYQDWELAAVAYNAGSVLRNSDGSLIEVSQNYLEKYRDAKKSITY